MSARPRSPRRGAGDEGELPRGLAEAAEEHTTQALSLTAQAARAQGWRPIATAEAEVRPGTRQHGWVAVSRAGSRFLIAEEERAFAVLTWIYAAEQGLVFFEAGEYDLRRAEALRRFAARARAALARPRARRGGGAVRGQEALAARYQVAHDSEPAPLDEPVERAGLGWRCQAEPAGLPCNDMNVGASRCGGRGAGEAEGKEEPDG